MPKAPRKKVSSKVRPKDPKASHLYTDDNPATTIHGTGFKDRAAAERTFKLIDRRSLTYQFQTINTMWHRANGHPHKNEDMKDAMKLFREWLDETYPTAKKELRQAGWKPLLSKDCVQKYLGRIRDAAPKEMGGALKFAEKYVELPKGKRLANVLMDDDQPQEADMDRMRYDALCNIVVEGKESARAWSDSELWDKGKQVTDEHLRLIAWAWSPVGERMLP